jgi:hypothetical protein
MTTSKPVAYRAGKDLRSPKTPKQDPASIASDLAQASREKKSGPAPMRSWAHLISDGELRWPSTMNSSLSRAAMVNGR